MGRLKTVAGSQMENLLEAVNTEIHFVTLCTFQVSPELGGQVRGARCLPREWEVELTSALLEISFDWRFLLTGATHGRWSWNPSPTGGPLAGE